MDFRAMLKRKKYAKWKDDKEDPNWELKKAEEEKKPQLKKVERVSVDSLIYFTLYSRFLRYICQQKIRKFLIRCSS
jgi:hypothetical protein